MVGNNCLVVVVVRVFLGLFGKLVLAMEKNTMIMMMIWLKG